MELSDSEKPVQPQGILSNVRTAAGDNCMTSLSRHNSPLIMSQCGSKGSPVNIAQMVACVGQQVTYHVVGILHTFVVTCIAPSMLCLCLSATE